MLWTLAAKSKKYIQNSHGSSLLSTQELLQWYCNERVTESVKRAITHEKFPLGRAVSIESSCVLGSDLGKNRIFLRVENTINEGIRLIEYTKRHDWICGLSCVELG